MEVENLKLRKQLQSIIPKGDQLEKVENGQGKGTFYLSYNLNM